MASSVVKWLSHSAVYHWSVYREHGPPATSRKHPAFSSLDAEACQPTASIGSISLPRAWPPPLTNNDNGVMLYWKGGHNHEKLSHPAYKLLLMCFVLRLRLQKGGRICGTLRYMLINSLSYPKGEHIIGINTGSYSHSFAWGLAEQYFMVAGYWMLLPAASLDYFHCDFKSGWTYAKMKGISGKCMLGGQCVPG